MQKRILITGGLGGFGKLTVEALVKKGHKVVGTTRSLGKYQEAVKELETVGAQVIEMDVTDEQSVNEGVNKAIELLGGLDVLINNAGVGVIGIQETFTPEDFQKVFEINVIGVQRVTRAVLPHFREKGDGLLAFTSSLLGRITLPFYGPYNATKWALEALAENYRTELSAFGIESCIVEPGGFPTAFIDNLVRPSDKDREGTYDDFAQAPQASLEGFEGFLAGNPQQNPQIVADAFVKLIETPKGEKPMRTTVDTIGMGDAISPYNDQLHKVTHAIYSNFGTDGMLTVKK